MRFATRRNRADLWSVLLVGLVLQTAGCAYDLTAQDAPPGQTADTTASTCIPNQAVFCDCPENAQGVQTCGADGEWLACDCDVTVGPPTNPGDAGPPTWSVTCETDRYWDNYEDDGEPESEETMIPGGDCIGCHEDWDEGPDLAVGGTVFIGLHDADDCYGVSGVTVEIVGADDRVYRLRTNATGNFLAETDEMRIAVPYTARVITSEGERAMVTPQTDLSCNRCHSIAGTEGAPGRIVLPTPSVQ